VTPFELLVGIAGHGLSPSPRPIADDPVGTDSWEELSDSLGRGLLLGLALDAADCGALPVTKQQRDDLTESFALAQDRRSAADRCLDEVVAVLERRGIETCVMHGAANAALDYDQQGLRLYDTLHLLVAPSQREEAVAALAEHDVVRCDVARRRPRRQTALPCRSRDGVRVVLYNSLAPKNFRASVAAGDLFPSRVPFVPRSVTLNALAGEERLIAACVHARLNVYRRDLLAQRDLVQLVLRENLSVRKVERLASTWRLEAVLAEAVRRAWATFRVPDVVPISVWSSSYQPFKRDRRRLAAHPLPSFGA
jgi:Uncharacterised nucleotidyltransferase